MTKKQLKEHQMRRRKIAFSIMFEAYLYHVCDQCLSMTDKRRGVCEVCGCYRWDESLERVYEVGHLMAKQYYPATLGYFTRKPNP